MELLLCRFSELEYRLPPRDFHPPNPSHYLIPRLYFCCMLIAAFIHRTPTLPLPRIQLNQYHLDLVSGLAFNHHSVYTLRLCTLEDTITVHTVASLRPLRGLRFCFPTHLDRVIVITPHLSLSALPHNTPPSKRRTLLAVFMANELSYEAAASTNTQRTPCFRCFLQDVRLTSIRE